MTLLLSCIRETHGWLRKIEIAISKKEDAYAYVLKVTK